MINRLIIIGNGFDIAHDLKTKYSDFVDNYFSNLTWSGDWDDQFFQCEVKGMDIRNLSTLDSILKYLNNDCDVNFLNKKENILVFKNLKNQQPAKLNIKNRFFYDISKSHSTKNWVDIENEYFKKLISIIDYVKLFDAELIESNLAMIYKDITILNKEMDEIKLAFEKYLIDNVIFEINNKKIYTMENVLYNEMTELDIKKDIFYREFNKSYSDKLKTFNKTVAYNGINYLKFNQTAVLNFNYTQTFEKLYRGLMINQNEKTLYINIHGSLSDEENPLNLGFGDEMSKRYGDIEDFNENEYLRLMKSFAYSNNSNYKKLFDFIETNDFQVHVMGHSCGTSDRTLLNSIFENHNCKSIKVFYHKSKKGDNYSDIVKNISRHFNQKIMMREKIVNKEFCEPLPQFKKQ